MGGLQAPQERVSPPLGVDAWAVPSSPALLLLPLPARSSRICLATSWAVEMLQGERPGSFPCNESLAPAQPGAASSWKGNRGVVLVVKPGFTSAGVLKVRGSSVVQACPWRGKEMCLSERSLATSWALSDSKVAFSWMDKAHLAAFKMPYFSKSCSSEFQSLYFMNCSHGIRAVFP